MALLEPPQDLLKLLRESLPEEVGTKAVDHDDGSEEILAYVAFIAAGLTDAHEYDASVWEETLQPYLSTLVNENKETVEKFREAAEKAYALDGASLFGDDDDDGEELCDLRFNLAYGGKILLHQTRLRLVRGRRYALVGQNGTGKTTLMNAINNGKLDGWPHELKTAYVDSGSNVDPVFEAQMMLAYLVESTGRSEADCVAKLKELDFTDQMMKGSIGALSGGWQMKHRLVRAVLMDPDIYLMDEPTNHLARGAVEWLTEYLNDLSHQTVLCVSHDVDFLNDTMTDVIHYENREVWGPYNKLVHYKGNMTEFAKHPQSKNYFRELAKEKGPLGNLNRDDDNMMKFVFPEPGRLDGIKTSTQKFIEMENVDFCYPGVDTNQLTDINLKMSLSSRVVVLGGNGAGKTTLIKMIVGETVPSNLGGACKFVIHPNVRVAYVAQHAFYHVEQHMDQSPVNYIQWRFKHGWDREKMESVGFKITPEEEESIKAFSLEGIWSRRMRAGILEYEVKKIGVPERDNKFFSKEALLALGLEKLLKQTDEKIASREAGLDLRPVTTSEIQKHLDGFGLAQEFGTYGKVKGLSGGQKVKLVLAAAFWTVPHLVVLDEPTNFLDREALGALSLALNSWGGAVLMISHSKEFYSSVCKEEWNVEEGRLRIEGVSSEREMKAIARKKKFEKELDNDEVLEKAGGNKNANGDKYKDATTNFWGQTVSKKEARQYDKAKKKGDVALMRKILQVPAGKIMPGYEELGDGK